MKRVAIIGTVGIPACYGGFETLAENLVRFCEKDVAYTVWCSSKAYPERLQQYNGAQLRYIPLKANGAQSPLFDLASMLGALRSCDTMLILGVSGCLFLPIIRVLFKKKIIVNIDGLEHRREKWGKLARKFLLASEKAAVRHADVVIADNKSIQDYVQLTYNQTAELIAYGGDGILCDVQPDQQQAILQQYGLESNGYAMALCRIEPENNCHLILEAFSHSESLPLLFIGNWGSSEYGRALKRQYGSSPKIQLLDAIYDKDVLYTLRSHTRCYIHGHSAGGTNPSLVEAMHFGRCILAYDCSYNRNSTFDKALYFKTAEELYALLQQKLPTGECLQGLAREHYTWEHIAHQYTQLF